MRIPARSVSERMSLLYAPNIRRGLRRCEGTVKLELGALERGEPFLRRRLDLVGDLGLVAEQRVERSGVDHLDRDRRGRDHRRGSRAVIDQGDLTDVVTGTARRQDLVAASDLDLAFQDDDELASELALRREHLAGPLPSMRVARLDTFWRCFFERSLKSGT